MSLPETYKAVICKGACDDWEISNIPIRDIRPLEVLIKVHASGICNSDHFIKEGTWPGIVYPRVPGHEVVGTVVSLGKDVSDVLFKIGSLVGVGWNAGFCHACRFCRAGDFAGCVTLQVTGCTTDGGHAEYIYAPVTSVVSLPEGLLEGSSYAEIAPLLCAGTAVYGALTSSKFKPGDICVVQGIGGLGHLAIQYATRFGLKVYAVSSGPSKATLAKSLGAFAHIDSSETSVVDFIQALGGAQLIISTSPTAHSIASIIPAAARNGTVTLVSAAIDGRIEVDNVFLNMQRVTLRGWSCGAAPDAEECIRFSALAGIKSMVRTWRLEQFAEAYDNTMSGAPRFRNVIVF